MGNKPGGNGHKPEQEMSLAENELTIESIQHVLEQRAARLARLPVQQEEGDRHRLVLVKLNGEIFALDTHTVFDIWPAQQITRVPRVPDWVQGVVNRRGRILSVVDLHTFLGLAHPDDGHGTNGNGTQVDAGTQPRYLILLQVPEMEVVLQVDDVLGVEALLDSRIQEHSGTVRGIPQEYVLGISELDQNRDKSLVVILDVHALLTDERLVVHQQIR